MPQRLARRPEAGDKLPFVDAGGFHTIYPTGCNSLWYEIGLEAPSQNTGSLEISPDTLVALTDGAETSSVTTPTEQLSKAPSTATATAGGPTTAATAGGRPQY